MFQYMSAGQNRGMTIKERDDLVIKLYNMMNEIHKQYNSNLVTKNYNSMLELCITLGAQESRAVKYMLDNTQTIGSIYLNRYYKFIPSAEVAQGTSLEIIIRAVVYKVSDSLEDVLEVEKETKKQLLKIFDVI